MKITDIVLDFDGTCTQIPIIYERYLAAYLSGFIKLTGISISKEQWVAAQQKVAENSPEAAWTLVGAPAAPAAADPYILAYESAKYILRVSNSPLTEPPFEIHKAANDSNQAPWRPESRHVFQKLLDANVNIHFVSNSSSIKIRQRLEDLWGGSGLPSGISIQSDAAKFRISELGFDSHLPIDERARFGDLPVTVAGISLKRPVYLRRGSYFEALCATLGNLKGIRGTVFCGDIWEMDLAMPYALGGNIHFIERAAPFTSYPYEIHAVKSGERGKVSHDLNGLLDWL